MSLLDTASLIVTPNGYKEGTLYSVIPSDGSGDMSVVRATTATRVNSAGLVELVPYNLVQYSEQFDNAAWGKTSVNGADAPVVTANSTTAPNGTLTADKVVFNAPVSGDISILNQNISLTDTANGSIYVKAFSSTDVGKIIAFRFNGGAYELITLTDSWQRFSATQTASTSFDIHLRPAVGTSSGSVSVYLWGAQLNEGSTALPYQKTETRLNIPRLDYSNGTCPSLLVEPQRTNLALYSSSFDNWDKINAGTSTIPVVTANYAASPDGTQNADRIQCSVDTSSSSNYSLVNSSNSPTLSSTGTLTIYLKSNTSSNQNVLAYWGGGQGQVFNVTPEWQRFTLSNMAAITTGIAFGTRGGSGNFFNGGDATLDILAYGAQLEVGTYATSYIPTTSASVTRNADQISKTGISSLIGQTEGTMFQDIYIDDILNAGSYFNFQILGTSGNVIAIAIYSDGRIQFAVLNGGALQVNIDLPSFGLTAGHHKFAAAYKNNDFVFYVDGVQVGSDTSGSVPATTKIDLSDTANGKQKYNAAALYKTRLTNAELATLTTI